MSKFEFENEPYLSMERIRREGRHELHAKERVLAGREIRTLLLRTEKYFKEMNREPTGHMTYNGHDFDGWFQLLGTQGVMKEYVWFYSSGPSAIRRYVIDHTFESYSLADKQCEPDTKVQPWRAAFNKRYELAYFRIGTLEQFDAFEWPPTLEYVSADFQPYECDLTRTDITSLHMLDDVLRRAIPVDK